MRKRGEGAVDVLRGLLRVDDGRLVRELAHEAGDVDPGMPLQSPSCVPMTVERAIERPTARR